MALRPLFRSILTSKVLPRTHIERRIPQRCQIRDSFCVYSTQMVPENTVILDSKTSASTTENQAANQHSTRLALYDQQWHDHFTRFGYHLYQNKFPAGDPTAVLPKDLRHWFDQQRHLFHRKLQGYTNRVLSDQRLALLISLLKKHHVSLQPRQDFWNNRFEQVQAFVEMHSCFPCDLELDQLDDTDQKLWHWCFKQRQQYTIYQRNQQEAKQQYTSMTAERIDRLNSIGFVWNENEARWERNYELLREYYNHHYDTLVPEDYVNDPALGRWVGVQRRHHRLYQDGDSRSIMTPQRIAKLEALDFSWNALDAKWMIKLKQLQDHMAVTGTIPTAKQDAALYAWCTRQRQQWRCKQQGQQTALTDEREEKLNELNFPWQ